MFIVLQAVFLLQVPVKNIMSGVTDPKSGTSEVPFAAYFDLDTSSWSTSGISVLYVENGSVTVQTSHLSYFSALMVSAGCDSIPLSGRVLDSCQICGGDNSACSGCDGIPNSGRNKSCSGHGRCGVKECICNSDWHGEDCHQYCR